MIESIRDDEGVWRVRQEEIGVVLVDYYKSLFASTDQSVTPSVLECVPTMITEEMNEVLCCKFEESEVTKALNQMAPLKAPGPDGMPPLFYQHFWGTVSHDVISSILMWLNSGTLPTPLNHTFIALIPKVNSPEYANQFRPISLCNVLYKIYSKILANRLKKLQIGRAHV